MMTNPRDTTPAPVHDRRRSRTSTTGVFALGALLTTAAPARADLILQVEPFALSGIVGSPILGFQPFDPDLGTLDRVSVSISGSFLFTAILAPGQAAVPSVTWEAFGLGGLGFEFAPSDALFLFPAVTNPSLLEPLPIALSTVFTLDFSLTNATDVVGFVIPSVGATGATLVLPTVVAQRSDFVARFAGDSVMEQFVFLPPAGLQPAGGFAGGGSVLLQYEFTPALSVPEPNGVLLLGAGVLLLCRRRR